jgi:hypothetical protein
MYLKIQVLLYFVFISLITLFNLPFYEFNYIIILHFRNENKITHFSLSLLILKFIMKTNENLDISIDKKGLFNTFH